MRELPQGYVITAVVPDDIPALIEVDKAASQLFAPTGLLREDALYDHVPAEIFAAAIQTAHITAVRSPTGELVGFTLTSIRGTGLYLDQISVHPAHGQRGIGSALVVCVLHDAEEQHLPGVSLSTFRSLPWNGPFYASLGFREIPRARLEPFMLDIEDAQRTFMDVSARCFMHRRVRRPLLRFRRLRPDPS